MTSKPRVFTVPASAPFLTTLARALLDGNLIPGFAPRGDPLALASATVYLPTRRAVRAFGEALLEESGAEATLLPRILPLGEVDEDALAFAEAAVSPERPSPIAPAARRLVLARLVLQFAKSTARGEDRIIASSPAAALQLADELARLFDDMTIAGVSFDALNESEFVPAELDEYWKRSLEFLNLARPAWEAHLAERMLVDPTAWRDQLLAREAKRLEADGGPVVAAGSTGTIPAVAKLIATIATFRQGAVVLPGLDQRLDEASFRLISGDEEHEPSSGHPQFGLKRLIERIGISRGDVEQLGTASEDDRDALLSEAFRPAATTDAWRRRSEDFGETAAQALAGVSLIEAGDPREEALALAVALRETLETPGATAALVTPDRALARRIAAELRRWDIEVDDSAGVALADSEAGRLARLAAKAAADNLAPVPLLALLRHPLTQFGFSPAAIDMLEIGVLRGPRPSPGADGLVRALEEAREQARKGSLHRRDPRMALREDDWEAAVALARRAGDALGPLLRFGTAEAPFVKLVAAHRDVLVRLGVDLTRREPADLRTLGDAFDRFNEAAPDAAPIRLADYADLFGELLAGESPVRPPFDRGARIRILGPLEARLIEGDRVLLGGLNEGTWPPETHADAWLNRPMRRRLGLDLPERRIGLTAHDFAQAMGAREAIVSRARKENGVEMVASRFLQRLAAVAPTQAWDEVRKRGRRYLELAQALERAAPVKTFVRPQPTPPVAARPKRLSVTEVETLIRDPYSIYARHVLRLDPLEEIDSDPGAAERGTIIHDALAEFARGAPQKLPPDALERLLRAGEQAFARLKDFPGLHAVWWPRFVRVAHWLVGEEETLRERIDRVFAETNGSIEFDAGGETFRLTARADRVDRHDNGAVTIIDYKTGEAPSLKQALIGLAPQMPLEAAIARKGGFEKVPDAGAIAGLLVIKPSGGEPPGKIATLDPVMATREAKTIAEARGIATCDDLADYAAQQVRALIAAYMDEKAPYQSIPRPKWRGRFGRYDHLARVREWSANEEGTE